MPGGVSREQAAILDGYVEERYPPKTIKRIVHAGEIPLDDKTFAELETGLKSVAWWYRYGETIAKTRQRNVANELSEGIKQLKRVERRTTQKGLAILDRLGKNLTRSRLPEVLHPLVRPIALQKLAELRLVGFEDPVDALLAVAFETDDEGEWKHPVEMRLDALKAAAPFCRPKLQAILARSDTGKGHVEWLKELKGYVEQEECEANGEDGPVIEHATANGNDPEPLAPEPDEPKDGEAVSEPAEPSWKPQSK
jgi:hypothetical protein